VSYREPSIRERGATMSDSSNERALDLLARAIAEEIWRQLVEGPSNDGSLEFYGGRPCGRSAGNEGNPKIERPVVQGTQHNRPAN
jgi:hypothetical protein